MGLVSRRALLAAGAAGLTMGAARVRPLAAAQDRALYVSANRDPAGRHRVTGFRLDGTVAFDVAVPGRAHGAAARPGAPDLAVCARRPGTFTWIVDRDTGAVHHRLEAPPGHHVYGHAAFGADGTRLYVTENAYDADAPGVLGVYAADAGYRRLGTVATGGIGPHEVRPMPDRRMLAVANGGLRTHPDLGRAVLNLGTMDPSLAVIDPETGDVMARGRLPARWRMNSIRHIAVTPDGTVVAAQQWQGAADAAPPLVALWRPGSDPVPLTAPPDIQARMRLYCGSACVDATGRVAAVSAPRGGLVTLWDIAATTCLGAVEVPDGCGVAADGSAGGFVLTSGAGGVWRHGRNGQAPLPGSALAGRHWDNHVLRVTG